MNTQPEALRLAHYFETEMPCPIAELNAAAELRRLHEENQALRQAAEMALEALETIKSSCREGRTAHAENEAAIIEHILRQALAQPPVAYRNKVDVKTGFIWNYTEAKLQDANGNDLVEYQELYL